MNELSLLAARNYYGIQDNPYPGRGLIIGTSDDGQNMVQVYWIMGRSEYSRNRVFETAPGGRLYTEAADPAKVKDPSLIIYDAMLENAGFYVVCRPV